MSEEDIVGTAEEVEQYVGEFGERYRRLIESSLRFLNENEPGWDLRRPIGRRSYLRDVISRARVPPAPQP